MLPEPILFPTLAVGLYVTVLSVAFAVVCFALMLVVLAQKPKGGGLAGAFGGGGGSEGAFVGAKIGDVLTWITVGFFVAFIGLAMGLTWAINPEAAEFEDPTVNSSTTNNGTTGATTSGGDTEAGEQLTEEAPTDASTIDLGQRTEPETPEADAATESAAPPPTETAPAE
ncbi:MAG: preprotein translocase subunit SecG [Planctomycetota bacterium]